MTATIVEIAPGAVSSRELRAHVRDRLEEEYLLLRAVERPALLEKFDAAGASDSAGAARAVALTDYRLAAIEHVLEAQHHPHPDTAVCTQCCVLLDQGAGPQWFLLAALSEGDLPVIASDSALGRALVGARPGETVLHPCPSGVRAVRVIALEPSVED